MSRNRKERKITLDMILASTSLTRSRSETNEQYLQRVTHLHLQGQHLKKIEKLDQCTNLKVCYSTTYIQLIFVALFIVIHILTNIGALFV